MSASTRPSLPANGNDYLDPAAEALSLRRKVLFWRRALLFVLGLAVLVVAVAWQRTALRSRECAHALRHYAELVQSSGLDRLSTEAFEIQWQRLSREGVNVSPTHYRPIPYNWMRRPAPNEVLPLAVCRDSHIAFLSRGRHVLFRDDQKTYVQWISEKEAELLLKGIQLDKP